jgi:chaperonin GroEL (HSP60 family)
MKSLVVGPEARKLATSSLVKIATAVATTLGPRGMPFIFEKDSGLDGKPMPTITKDGLTVLRSMSFADPADHAVHAMCVQASSRTVLAGGDGPQPLWASILTPNGYIEMGDAKEGMEICGVNGTVQTILGVFPKGKKKLWKVSFDTKAVPCCGEHLWQVTDLVTGKTEVMMTKDLAKNVKFEKEGNLLSRYETPLANANPNLPSGDKITSIEEIEKVCEMQCIKVSNPDSLYITNGGIVTHNTTSTIVMAAAVAQVMAKSLESSDRPQKLARDVLKQSLNAIAEISKEAIKSKEMARLVALTSANGDDELAKVAMEAVSANNAFGSIIIERNPMATARYEIINQEGLVGGRGYESARQTASSVDSTCVGQNSPFKLNSPLVVTYDGTITYDQALRILSTLSREYGANPIEVILAAYDIDVPVYNMITQVNLTNNSVKVWAHEMRDTGETNSRWHKLHDIAAFTGASVLNPAQVIDSSWTKESLGTCKEAVVSRDKTTYFGRSPNHTVPQRAIQNENAVKYAESEFDKEFIKSRNAELTSGLVKLIVGAGHTANVQERADRADDAIKAAQACLKTGALPGCGASYIRAASLAGVGIELSTALHKIHQTIMDNYGADPKLSFEKGETVCLSDEGLSFGDFEKLELADSFESVASVIRNGVELGILVSTLGGMSLTTDLEEIEKLSRAGALLGSMR